MEFRVSTDFEGQTVAGKIEEKGVHLSQLLGKQANIYVPLNIVEDLIEELQSVLYKVEELKEEKTEPHDTEDGNIEQLADILFNASKVLGSTVISGDTTVVDAQNITEAIRKMMESKDFKLL